VYLSAQKGFHLMHAISKPSSFPISLSRSKKFFYSGLAGGRLARLRWAAVLYCTIPALYLRASGVTSKL